MIDKELISKENYDGKIIEFNKDDFTKEIKRITREKNITQEQLFSIVEEKTSFSESKQKRWKAGIGGIDWEDLEQFCDITGAKMENFMRSKFEDKIFEKYVQAREISKDNLVSDDDEYCSKLKSFCDFFKYSDEHLANLNIPFEKVEMNINRLYTDSHKKWNDKIQRKKEEEEKEMEQKMIDEQNKRMELEKKYKDNFNKHAFLGKERIKLQCMLPCISAYICSVAFLGVNSMFNIVFSVLTLMLLLTFIFINLIFKITVKKEYFENYEDRDTHFLLCSMIFPVVTFLLLFSNSFEVKNVFFATIYFLINCIYILFAIFTEIVFLKNIECLTIKK